MEAPHGTSMAPGPATAGPLPDEPRIREALSAVLDPEIGLDVVTLGLIYEIGLEEARVRVTYTLTTPGCPMAGILSEDIEDAVRRVPGVAEVELRLVWDPPWNPGMIAEDAW